MLTANVMTFLEDAARYARTPLPGPDGSLFAAGVLDSFSLVDLVTLLESECGIRIGDDELRPENFDTLAKLDAFVERARSQQ